MNERLLNLAISELMDESRGNLAAEDEILKKDKNDLRELSQRYENLMLPKKEKMIVEDYIACMNSANDRYAEVSYIAGFRDALKLCEQMGMIKEEDDPDN